MAVREPEKLFRGRPLATNEGDTYLEEEIMRAASRIGDDIFTTAIEYKATPPPAQGVAGAPISQQDLRLTPDTPRLTAGRH